jgi:hypothetical protein
VMAVHLLGEEAARAQVFSCAPPYRCHASAVPLPLQRARYLCDRRRRLGPSCPAFFEREDRRTTGFFFLPDTLRILR